MVDKRRRINLTQKDYRPVYVVWELTLRCDHVCHHCGSRAGKARETELTLSEAKDVARQLGEMGTREVVLIGGEAYLYEGYLEVVAELRRNDVRVSMTSGGRGITKDVANDFQSAGLHLVSVSVDGTREVHDKQRNSNGSFDSAMAALDNLRNAGIKRASNININRSNAHTLEDVYALLKKKDITAWQVQVTAALGRAADRPDFLLQPYDLLDVMPRVAKLKEQGHRDGVLVMPGNNLGYFGPEEALMRSQTADGKDHWMGCQAGKFVMGIESDGAVKGCPSLQTTEYVAGHLTEQPLREIWDGLGNRKEDAAKIAFTRERTKEDLWGYCKTCIFADTCLGGCTFTSHALFGRPGNNPYCHFRAREMDKRGMRERVVRTEAASGLPFDSGKFELICEEIPSEQRKARSTPLVVLH